MLLYLDPTEALKAPSLACKEAACLAAAGTCREV